MKELKELLTTLTESTSATFASVLYESKSTGELARHTINLNTNLERIYREDLAKLEAELPNLTDEIEVKACTEMINSLKNSLEKGIGNNDRYTQKDVEYIRFKDKDGNFVKNIKMHPETYDIILSGIQVQKKVIEEGEYKEVKSQAKTLAKKELTKRLNLQKGNFRSYCITTNADKLKLHGHTIEIN
jgi:flagellar biosynthesis component FlhA